MASPDRRWPGRWYRLRVSLPTAFEDDAIGLLHRCAALGAEARPAGPQRLELRCWFEQRRQAQSALDELAGLEGLCVANGGVTAHEDPGWLEASLQPRRPLQAGRFTIVDDTHAATLEASAGAQENGRIEILIPRGRAFGTGEHETTRLCLQLLDAHLAYSFRPGATLAVLDLGTGSGILAIAAARAGARKVLALDDDPAVIEVARANVAANAVADRVEVVVGSWGVLAPGARFQLVLANIHRTALVRGAAALASRLAPSGLAIVSGFSPPDVAAVVEAWSATGFRPIEQLVSNDWAALALRRDEVRGR
ncbi:MAG: 50S ribosomal protein L11 methyltransferase [Acidobacteriota bacterium]|nr:MAG: 50S ribosomal protein L11 methyltransferase [Acidobacteriota bacterium]